MPTAPPRHQPRLPSAARHRPQVESRQARRALATNSAAWRAIRAHQLSIEPLCRMCKDKGKTTAASVCDHIDGDATHDEQTNYQSLCSHHHAVKTAKYDGGFGNTVRRREAERDA